MPVPCTVRGTVRLALSLASEIIWINRSSVFTPYSEAGTGLRDAKRLLCVVCELLSLVVGPSLGKFQSEERGSCARPKVIADVLTSFESR